MVPRECPKNLQKVCGKSLIAHAFNCAANSKYEMDVVISTDSPEILEHAQSIGYKDEYLRPDNLAQMTLALKMQY